MKDDMLSLDNFTKERLSEIATSVIWGLIEDDKEKAGAQVRIANQRRAEEYNAWYRAYCD